MSGPPASASASPTLWAEERMEMVFPLAVIVMLVEGRIEMGELEMGELRGVLTRSPVRSHIDTSCRASPTVKADDWICFSPSGTVIVIGIARRICRVIG